MELLVTWCAFIGTWLLVAGPLYQAALELKGEDEAIQHLRKAKKIGDARLPKVPVWWWLLPPVKLVLERQRTKVYRRRYARTLSYEDIENIVSFVNKASGWGLVALGGFLLALQATFSLVRYYEWPIISFWLLSLTILLLSFSNVIWRFSRQDRFLDSKR